MTRFLPNNISKLLSIFILLNLPFSVAGQNCKDDRSEYFSLEKQLGNLSEDIEFGYCKQIKENQKSQDITIEIKKKEKLAEKIIVHFNIEFTSSEGRTATIDADIVFEKDEYIKRGYGKNAHPKLQFNADQGLCTQCPVVDMDEVIIKDIDITYMSGPHSDEVLTRTLAGFTAPAASPEAAPPAIKTAPPVIVPAPEIVQPKPKIVEEITPEPAASMTMEAPAKEPAPAIDNSKIDNPKPVAIDPNESKQAKKSREALEKEKAKEQKAQEDADKKLKKKEEKEAAKNQNKEKKTKESTITNPSVENNSTPPVLTPSEPDLTKPDLTKTETPPENKLIEEMQSPPISSSPASTITVEETAVKDTPPPPPPAAAPLPFPKEEYEEKVKSKVEQLQEYLQRITDKKSTVSLTNSTIEQCLKLFINNGVDAIIGVSSSKTTLIRKSKVRDYLTNLSRLLYQRVEITWSEIFIVDNFKLGPDNNYHATVSFQQTFKGFNDERMSYGDVTHKNIEIIIKPYSRLEEGILISYWEILLGDIRVSQTEKL